MAFIPILLVGIAGGALYMNRSRTPESPNMPQTNTSTPQTNIPGTSKITSLFTQTNPFAQANGQSPAPGWFSQPKQEAFLPGPVDVLVVKAMLVKGLSLPPEILDMIIDQAEYWPCTETSIEFSSANRPRINGGGHGSSSENTLLIRSPPIGFTQADVQDREAWRNAPPSETPSNEPISPEHFKTHLRAIPSLERPVRKVVFKLRSRDQAWGGSREHQQTYQGSWTWFEAGLERFETPHGDDEPEITRPFDTASLRPVYPTGEVVTKPNGQREIKYPLNPDEMHTIQRNRTAGRQMVDYEVVWRWTDDISPESLEAERLEEMGRGKASGSGDFVRNLKLGDVVSIWGKARFLGWANNVERASVQVYWAL